MILSGSLLGTLLGLLAALLVFSLFVQVVQELYKYLADSKGHTYTRSLVDMLGPWAEQLRRADALPHLLARGPFQFRRVRPRGVLLPMDQPTLLSALERTSPAWVQRTLNEIRVEADLQKGKPAAASPGWIAFVHELQDFLGTRTAANGKRTSGSAASIAPPGQRLAKEVLEFLETWHPSTPAAATNKRSKAPSTPAPSPALDAQGLLTAFRRRFLPHVLDAERDFPQLAKNFEHSYRRRNLRHSFTIAFVVAMLFNLPFQELWQAAGRLSDTDFAATSEKALTLFERSQNLPSASEYEKERNQLREAAKQLVGDLTDRCELQKGGGFSNFRMRWIGAVWKQLEAFTDKLFYILGCLFSAVLVSFGAPFWNDVAGAIFRAQHGSKPDET